MRRVPLLILLILLPAVFMAGCRQDVPGDTPLPTVSPVAPDETTPPEPSEAAYPPPPTLPAAEEAYPLQEQGPESAYPGPSQTTVSRESGPPFFIDEPVLAGATELQGRGPAGVPIRVVDVTTLGTELGNGSIGDDGTFVIQLGVPLEANHMIGLKIGNLSGTDFQEEDFIFGETYYDRPLVGILLDMAPVVPE